MEETKKNISLFHTVKRTNPSVEYLLGMLIEYRATIEQYRVRYKGDVEKQVLLDLCEHKIDEAERAIDFNSRFRKKIFLAWDLFHQIVADLVLCMDAAELCAWGRKLINDIKLSSLPDVTKTDSILRLDESLKKLDTQHPPKDDIERARHVAKTVTCTLNTHVDGLFWDIWTRKFIGLIYAVFLLVLLLVFIWRYEILIGCDFISIGEVALLGAMGGLLSGIFSSDVPTITKGQFWASTLYYSLVRPIQGALAAMAMFWMLQSQYLIKVEPPLAERSRVLSSQSSGGGRSVPPALCPYTSANPSTAVFNNDTSGKKAKSEEKASIIVLNAAKGKQIYLYVLVLLLAGFSGDKILKTVSDKVTGRLFTDADKTREAKKGT